MAKTYTYADAQGMMQSSFPKLQSVNYASIACDEVNGIIWNFADFGWTVGQMSPFYLVPLLQDYKSPLVTIPADFVSLRSAELYTVGDSFEFVKPILAKRSLQSTTTRQELPDSMAWIPEISAIRLYPCPMDSINSSNYIVANIQYKRQPKKITAATLTDTIPFDDRYFSVLTQGLRWVSLRDAGAPTADQAYAMFLNSLSQMASREAYEASEDSLKPFEPLVGW